MSQQYAIELGIDARKGQQGAREFKKSLSEVKEAATKTAESVDNVESSFERLKKAGGNFKSFGQSMMKWVTLPIVAAGGAAIKFAMDAVESENLFQVSMGRMADAARAFSENLRDSLGVNAFAVRRMVGTFNVMLKSMGLSEDAAFDYSTTLTQLANDMASFYNISTEEAFRKLTGGMTGEAESLKRLGIIVNETMVRKALLERGLISYNQTLSQTELIQGRYLTILDQTTAAQGDMARTMDSPANAFRIMKERMIEAGIALGTRLLPLMQDFAGFVQSAAKKMTDLDSNTAKWAISGAAALAVVGPLAAGFGTMLLMAGGLAAVLGTTLLPVVAVGGALIAGLTLLTGLFVKSKIEAGDAQREIDRYTESLKAMTKAELEAEREKILIQRDTLRSQIDNLSKSSGNTDQIAQLREQLGQRGQWFRQIEDRLASMGTTAENATNTTTTGLEAAAEAAEKLKDLLEDAAEGFMSLGQNNDITRGLREMNEELERAERIRRMMEGTSATPGRPAGYQRATDNPGLAATRRAVGGPVSETLQRRAYADSHTTPFAPKYVPKEETSFMDRVRGAPGAVMDAAKGAPGAALGALKQGAMGLLNVFNPLTLIATVFHGALEAVAPALEGLQPVVEMVGAILGKALAPILKGLFPIFKGLAIAATYVGQIFFTVSGWILKAVGWLIRGLGTLIDKIPGMGDFGLKAAGQALIDAGRGFTEAAQGMAEAREEIRDIHWTDIEENANGAADGLGRLADQLTNMPSVVPLAYLSYLATRDNPYPTGGGGGGGGTPITGGGGGNGGGDSGGGGGGSRPGDTQVTLNFQPGSIVTQAKDGHQLLEEIGRVAEQAVRAGMMPRLGVALRQGG